MENQPPKQVFFHIGLGKTASTYLQYKFFPKLRGIYYIQRTKYKKSPRIIARKNHHKFLVSREFDRQMERETKWFAGFYPHAKIIIILRQQDQWIASQYRRYIKNGGFLPFNQFIDLQNNEGIWDPKELEFYQKLLQVERTFGSKPLVLFHKDLKKDPHAFFNQICEFTGTSYDPNEIVLNPSHKSYSEKQLIILRKINRFLFSRHPRPIKNRIIHWLRFRSKWLFLHLLLYIIQLVPQAVTRNEVLIPEQDLNNIKSYYREDWDKCIQYAAQNE